MGKNLQAFVDGNGYLHGHGGFLGVWKRYEALYNNNNLSIVGEENSYTGVNTTDSWLDVTPSLASSNIAINDIATPTYLGNGVVLLSRQADQSTHGSYMPFISSDSGKTWAELPAGDGYVGELSAVYAPGKAVYMVRDLTGNARISRTEDYGVTWTYLHNEMPFNQSHANTLVYAGVDGQEQDVMLMGTYPNGMILKSIDHGETWTQTGFNGLSTTASVFAGDDGIVLGSTSTHLYRSENFGEVWQFVGLIEDLMPMQSNYLLRGGFFKANNGRIITHCTDIYNGNTGRFISDDGGQTWTKYSGLPGAIAHSIAVGNNQVVRFHGDDGNGFLSKCSAFVSYSSDNGTTFGSPISLPFLTLSLFTPTSSTFVYTGNGKLMLSYPGTPTTSGFKTKIFTLGTW